MTNPTMIGEWRRHYGWLVAGASFIQFFFGFGTMASYVLLYVELEKEFETASASALGWVASIAWGLSSMMSVVSSPLYEKFGQQKVITVGVFLTFFGILGTTFAPHLWIMYLTFGVILGAGFNFVYNPSINMVTAYFPTMNCTRATSGATMGSTIGLLIMCPLLDFGFGSIGWRNTYRIVAGVYLLVALPLCMLMQPPTDKYHYQFRADDEKVAAEKGQLKPISAVDIGSSDISDQKEISKNNWKKYVLILSLPHHWLYFFGVAGTTLAAVFNMINLGSVLTHAGLSEDNAAFLIMCMTIAELLTRFLIAAFGDCLPCARTLLFPITCVLAGVGCMVLGFSKSYASVIIYVSVAGFARGVVFSLPYGVAVEVFGASKSVEVYTSLLVAFGIGGLLASVIPGLSFDLTGSYTASLHICSGIWILCGILFLALYLTYRKSRLRNAEIASAIRDETKTDIEAYSTLLHEDEKKLEAHVSINTGRRERVEHVTKITVI